MGLQVSCISSGLFNISNLEIKMQVPWQVYSHLLFKFVKQSRDLLLRGTSLWPTPPPVGFGLTNVSTIRLQKTMNTSNNNEEHRFYTEPVSYGILQNKAHFFY